MAEKEFSDAEIIAAAKARVKEHEKMLEKGKKQAEVDLAKLRSDSGNRDRKELAKGYDQALLMLKEELKGGIVKSIQDYAHTYSVEILKRLDTQLSVMSKLGGK